MIPSIDRATLYLLGGIIVGYAEAHGWLDQSQHTANVDTAQSVLGGIIIGAAVIWSMIHHTIIEKNKLIYEQPTQPLPVKKFSLQSLFTAVRSFIIKKPDQSFEGSMQD
jgi:hypothetical protein